MKSTKSGQSNFIEQPPRRRIGASWIVPLLLLWMLPTFGAQSAVVFTNLYSFTGTDDGCDPNGLVQGSDGYFYGTTQGGGTTNDNVYSWGPSGYGTVFKITTNGALTSLYSFTSGNDGGQPYAGLVQGSDGYFYGTTVEGGPNGSGTVFKISTNGVLTTLYSFGTVTDAHGNPLDGAAPTAALVQGSDGYFYGTTEGGGPNGCGTVFKISTNGALTSLHFFTVTNDGANLNGLVQGSDGNFYGTTGAGGTNGCGTVFKISTNGVLTTLYAFTGGNDGRYPQAGLVQESDGIFYGTTYSGGMNNGGTVFKITTNGALTTLYSFGSTPIGSNSSGLVQGSDGYFYGMNVYQYIALGTVFKISTNGVFTSLYSLRTGTIAVSGGTGTLVQGTDGSFYGTTGAGGTNGYGSVFRLTIVPDPQLTIIPSEPYVILTWPTDYNGFSYGRYTLQSTTNLGSAAVWTTNSPAPVVVNGQNTVTNSITGSQQFYRLVQ
jgi:uncharacterized repeat protein (TIGR03803 family)